jgi:hypothetical protein
MRTSMAYFAGAGTVVAALAVGLGGGLVVANIVSPQTRDLGKVELQAKAKASQQVAAQSEQPQQQAPSQPSGSDLQPKQQAAPVGAAQAPVPYLAQIEHATTPVVVSAAPRDPPPQAVQKSQDPSAQRHEEAAKESTKESAKEPTRESIKADSQQAATTSAGTDRDPSSKSENAYAKAREADLKRDEKRQRHQQWSARRQRDREQQPREADRDVREDSDPRDVVVRRDDDRPDFGRRDFGRRDVDRSDDDGPDFDRPRPDRSARFGFPRVNLFGPDDD